MSTVSTSGHSLPLFDPNGGAPPADAVELYLEAPRSLGVFYAAACANQHSDERGNVHVEAVERIQQIALERAVQVIKREGSYAKVGEHIRVGNGQPTIGKYLPATLYLTAISERFADQRTDVARLHEHVYIGAQALVHEDDQDWPTDLGSLKRVLSMAQAEYRHNIVKISEKALELRWSHVAETDSIEIVEPRMADHITSYPHVMCAGSFSPRHRWISRDVSLDDLTSGQVP